MKDYAFGNLLTSLRLEKGYSQFQLGQLVGVSDKAVSKWENGSAKPRMATCCKLAEVLEISLDTLLAEQDNRQGAASWVSRTMKREKQMSTRRDEAPVKRVELHTKTYASVLDGIGSPVELTGRIACWGHDAVAVTDFHSMMNLPLALDAAHREGIKLIPGCELCLHGSDGQDAHVMLLSKNNEGIKALNHLLTSSQKDPLDVTKELITQYRKNLLVGCSCEQGEVQQALLSGASEEQLHQIASFYDYLEIQPPENEPLDLPQARNVIRQVVKLGQAIGKPVVAVSNAHYLDPEDSRCRNILLYSTGRIEQDTGKLHLRTTDEMMKSMAFLGAKTSQQVVIEASRALAEQVDGDISLYPPRQDAHKPLLPALPHQEETVATLAWTQAQALYGNPLPAFVQERLTTELELISKQNGWIYYLIARQIAEAVRKQNKTISVRGVCNSSFAAWLLGITNVNPLPPHYVCPSCHHVWLAEEANECIGADLPARACPVCGTDCIGDGANLPSASCFGLHGEKNPDFELDIPETCQSLAEEQLEAMFGKEHVIRTGGFQSPDTEEIKGFTRQYLTDHHQTPSEATVNALTEKLYGSFCRQQIMPHAGRYVIIPQPYSADDFTPLTYCQREHGEACACTHYDAFTLYHVLLKFTCCYVNSHSMLDRLQELTGIDPATVPLGDPQVLSLFRSPDALGTTSRRILCETGTYGIPHFADAKAREILLETQPQTVNDLIITLCLLCGTGVWSAETKAMLHAGKVTLRDLPAAREDVMYLLLRKGIAYETAYHMMEDLGRRGKFTDAMAAVMQQHGVDDWYIAACKKIRYMFPRAHTSALVFNALRCAWFKLHDPEAFYTAALEPWKDVLQDEDIEMDEADLRVVILRERNKPVPDPWKMQKRLMALELLLEKKVRQGG